MLWNEDKHVAFVLGALYVANHGANISQCRLCTLIPFLVFGVIMDLYCVTDVDKPILVNLFYIITVIINVVATSAIVWKLIHLRQFLHHSNKEHKSLASRTSGVGMILFESAMLYTILGVVFVFALWYKVPASSYLGTAFKCLAVGAFMNYRNVTET
jgi:hypothetical protein